MTDLLPDLAPAPAPSSPATLPSCAPDNPEEALSWLGGTVEEVVEGLRERGIKGRRHSSTSCPLATYLGSWWDASVGGGLTGSIFNPDIIIFALPNNCGEFVGRFDRGDFPDLIF